MRRERQTDVRTDMTKLMVAFPKFTNVRMNFMLSYVPVNHTSYQIARLDIKERKINKS